MTNDIERMNWRLPWRRLDHPLDSPALQRQLERELAGGHPLWGKDAEVVGRRVDTDDVVVRCRDGALATVHLDWAKVPHSRPWEYPSVLMHQSAAALQQLIDSDAADYGDDE